MAINVCAEEKEIITPSPIELEITENGEYPVNYFDAVNVNVSGGGGGIEMEKGVLVHDASSTTLEIPFQNTHTTAPTFVVIAREEFGATPQDVPTGYAVVTLCDFDSILGCGEYVKTNNYGYNAMVGRVIKSNNTNYTSLLLELSDDTTSPYSSYVTATGITLPNAGVPSQAGNYSWAAYWL